MRAVRFEQYGGPEVLEIVDVPDEVPGPGQVVVAVVDSGINPGEIPVREGAYHERWPADFPEGQGSDFSGRIAAVADGVDSVAVGDEVIGMSDERSGQAQFVVIDADRVVPKPATLPWDVAGSLYVVATTAEANLRAVDPQPGETVVVAGAAGGVGFLTAQLVRLAGARVLGIASEQNADVLREVGVEPIAYGDGLEGRIRSAAPDGVDAFVDTHGDGYVRLAAELGVDPARTNTITDFEGAGSTGAKASGMSAIDQLGPTVERIAGLIADGTVAFPIRARYPFDLVREAYETLASGHGHGKIVLHWGSTG